MKAEDLYEKMVTKEIGKLKNHSIYCLKKDKG